jgi:hypothetical protein
MMHHQGSHNMVSLTSQGNSYQQQLILQLQQEVFDLKKLLIAKLK